MRGLGIALLLMLGCSKDDKPADDKSGSAGGETVASNPARDAMIDAWKKAGLSPSAMTPASVPVGKDCQSGTVNKVDVLVCVYGSPADAKAAEKPALDWVGGTTGAAWASGAVLVAAADRHKADPSGRTINQLMKLAPK